MSRETIDTLIEFVSSIVTFFVGAWMFKVCWNYVIPEMFNLPALTYWQGAALMLIGHNLFPGQARPRSGA